jgi:aminoglycoside phosphotransferase family enzyme
MMAEFPPLIQAMLDPAFYPHHPKEVELIQTHISYLLLAGEPVDFGFLDFTTLEKRRHFCQEEIRLNRRFCPDVYLEAVPISRVGDAYRLGDDTEVVEHVILVDMPHLDGVLYHLGIIPETVGIANPGDGNCF